MIELWAGGWDTSFNYYKGIYSYFTRGDTLHIRTVSYKLALEITVKNLMLIVNKNAYEYLKQNNYNIK